MQDYTTASGHKINFGDTSTLIFDWDDIHIHTKNLNRYNGALNWKLIQHLALCIELVNNIYHGNPELAAQVAIHDFHEIYVGDMVSGLKQYCPGFQDVEEQWEEAVHQALGVPRGGMDCKNIDLLALALETHYLRHKAADAIQQKLAESGWYFVPTSNMNQKAFHAIAHMTLDECFYLVKNTVLKYQSMRKKNE